MGLLVFILLLLSDIGPFSKNQITPLAFVSLPGVAASTGAQASCGSVSPLRFGSITFLAAPTDTFASRGAIWF